MEKQEIKDLTHKMWDIRREYCEKINNTVLTVYNELGGFLKGINIKGKEHYFLLQDNRVVCVFEEEGLFNGHPDVLELDCYGLLSKVDSKEFMEAFETMQEVQLNKKETSEHLWRDLSVVQQLIWDETFRQLRNE